MARKLKIPIELDADRALRKAKDLKREVRGIGDKAEGAGDKGKKSFDLMGRGVDSVKTAVLGLAGVGGIMLLMRKVDELRTKWLASFAAMAKAADLEGQRQLSAAQIMASPEARELRDVAHRSQKWTLPDIARLSRKAVADIGIASPSDWIAAAKPIMSRMPGSPLPGGFDAINKWMGMGTARGRPQREALRDTMVLSEVAGIPGAEAGQLAPLLKEQFGADTREKQRQGMASVWRIAQESSYTGGQFASQLPRIAAPLKAAGVKTVVEQAAYLSAFSLVAPRTPALAGRALEQMAMLPLKHGAFTARLLQRAGKNPRSRNLDDTRQAIAQFLREAAQKGPIPFGEAMQELQGKVQLPIRLMRRIAQASEAEWEAKFESAKRLGVDARWSEVEGIWQQHRKERGAGFRSALATEDAGVVDLGAPAGPGAAAGLIKQWGTQLRGPGYMDRIMHGMRAQNIRLRGGAPREGAIDEPLTKEQYQRLDALVAIGRKIRWRLNAIAETRAGTPVAAKARQISSQLTDIEKQATGSHAWGESIEYFDRFGIMLQDSMEFLQNNEAAGAQEWRDTAPTPYFPTQLKTRREVAPSGYGGEGAAIRYTEEPWRQYGPSPTPSPTPGGTVINNYNSAPAVQYNTTPSAIGDNNITRQVGGSNE